MLWIHGGDYVQGYGGGQLYENEWMVNRSGVVLVTINYRLGLFGFLATTHLAGNYGLEDQRLAMQWVQDNIAAFGGDPNQVTLFGQSAGAVSVALHIISPASDGLFARAIVESEPYGIPLRTRDEMVVLGSSAALDLGCMDGNTACLRSRNSSRVLAAQQQCKKDFLDNLDNPLQMGMAFTPLVGPKGGAIPQSGVLEAFQTGQYRDLPIMMGNVANEGVLFLFEISNKSLPSLLLDGVFGVKEAAAVRAQYQLPKGWSIPNMDLAPAITDYVFLCPARNASEHISSDPPATTAAASAAANAKPRLRASAAALASGAAALPRGASASAPLSPYYNYVFDHPMSFAVQGWGPRYSFCYNVTCHGGELPFVFPVPSVMPYTDQEMVLAANTVDYWTNFARFSDPNAGSATASPPRPNWEAFTTSADASPDVEAAMWLQTPTSQLVSRVNAPHCDFWDQEGYHAP